MFLPDSDLKWTLFQFSLRIQLWIQISFPWWTLLSPAPPVPPKIPFPEWDFVLWLQGLQAEGDLHGAVSIPLSASQSYLWAWGSWEAVRLPGIQVCWWQCDIQWPSQLHSWVIGLLLSYLLGSLAAGGEVCVSWFKTEKLMFKNRPIAGKYLALLPRCVQEWWGFLGDVSISYTFIPLGAPGSVRQPSPCRASKI